MRSAARILLQNLADFHSTYSYNNEQLAAPKLHFSRDVLISVYSSNKKITLVIFFCICVGLCERQTDTQIIF